MCVFVCARLRVYVSSYTSDFLKIEHHQITSLAGRSGVCHISTGHSQIQMLMLINMFQVALPVGPLLLQLQRHQPTRSRNIWEVLAVLLWLKCNRTFTTGLTDQANRSRARSGVSEERPLLFLRCEDLRGVQGDLCNDCQCTVTLCVLWIIHF